MFTACTPHSAAVWDSWYTRSALSPSSMAVDKGAANKGWRQAAAAAGGGTTGGVLGSDAAAIVMSPAPDALIGGALEAWGRRGGQAAHDQHAGGRSRQHRSIRRS